MFNVYPFPTLHPAISPPSARYLPGSLSHPRLCTCITTEFHFATKRTHKSPQTPLPPKPIVIAAPALSVRRRSRVPNVADRLVVELDDDERIHSIRGPAPSPDSNEQTFQQVHFRNGNEAERGAAAPEGGDVGS